jgi:hypothetical protein
MCECQGEGFGAVALGAAGLGLSHRWYVTIEHAGFNSKANNAHGYGSAAAARAAIRFYLRCPSITEQVLA